MEEHNIKNRSSEVQEILGTPPSFLIRWGTLLAFILFASLVLTAWMVKYPDIIEAPVSITSSNPPVKIQTKKNGQITKLLYHENDWVIEGDVLAVLETVGEYDDILELERIVEDLLLEKEQTLMLYNPSSNLVLGPDIQKKYADFVKDFENFKFNKISDASTSQIQQRNVRILTFRTSIKTDEKSIQNLEDKIAEANKRMTGLQDLYADGLITIKELQKQSDLVTKMETQVGGYYQNINATQIKIKALEGEILDIQQSTKSGESINFYSVQEHLNNLKSSILLWQKQNLLTATVDGQVSLHTNEQEFVEQNEHVITLTPKGQNNLIVRASVSDDKVSQIGKGQEVLIKLNGYPYLQFGSIKGKIDTLPRAPKNHIYLIKINLTNGLHTTRKKEIEFNREMRGSVSIITQERRFLVRIFDKFKGIFKKF